MNAVHYLNLRESTNVAKYKKKRARELQHDKFRDAAGRIFDRVGDRLEGKGKTILYGIGGVVVLALIVGLWVRRSNQKADEAQRAMGRAIAVMSTPLVGDLSAQDPNAPKFSSEQERAQRAIDEFQKVAAKYGDPYRTQARYFAGTSLLVTDRPKGLTELAEVGQSNLVEAAVLAKFALAQAMESDARLDEAAKLYSEIAGLKTSVVAPDTANVRLAGVYEKQNKKKEAADILFSIIEAARNAKEADGTSIPLSGAAREASEKLQKVDPDRYAKLTPQAPGGNLPF